MSFFLFLCAGCATFDEPPPASVATPPAATTAPPVESVAPVPAPQEVGPETYRAEIERSARVGTMIYLHDKAEAIATDVLIDRLGEGGFGGIGGYVSVQDPGAAEPPLFTVYFFSRDPEPQIVYRVRVAVPLRARPTLEAVTPPARPDEEVAALIRARRTAAAALQRLPPFGASVVNTVVLPARPALGEDGLVVYLLAATKQAGLVVLGKHHRALVTADGRRVVRLEPLSKGPIEIPLARNLPAGAKPVGIVVSHSVTEYPLETHVFASLQHHIPIMVVTPRASWDVDGERIELRGKQGQAEPAPTSSASGPACAPVCAAAVGRCPNGPPNQTECMVRCEQMRSGACAARYEEAFACAGPNPAFVCDARSRLTIGGCERQFEAVLRCYARERPAPTAAPR